MAGECNIPQTKKSTRRRIVDTTKQYSSTTTIHGISYLTGDDVSGLERLLWAIVVLFAMAFTTYQVITLYNDWQDQPVITTLDTVSLPIEEIEFPAVTICPQGSRREIVDSVLFRQLKRYIQDKEGNVTNLTEDEMMDQVEAFITEVYPGATEKPTKLINLMTSDNPEVSLKNQAVLKFEQECDPSSNVPFTNALNKQLKNDTCPQGFEMAKALDYCVHAKSIPMTYNDATKYCNGLGGSKLFYLETFDDLNPFDELLHVSGNVVILSVSRSISAK